MPEGHRRADIVEAEEVELDPEAPVVTPPRLLPAPQEVLELLESFGSIVVPLELVGLPEKFEEG